jgi:hypothetical protein
MSNSSATSPAELSLRPTLWRTRGNGRRVRPATTSCARRTLKQPAWLALGRLLPRLANLCGCSLGRDASRWPTPSVVPLDPKRTASGQPFRLSSDQSSQPFGCASGQDASRWPTTLVVPVIKSAPRPADSATILALSDHTLADLLGYACRPLRLCLPAITAALASYYSCAPSFWDRCGTFADDSRDLSLDNPRPVHQSVCGRPLALRCVSRTPILPHK